MNTLSAETFRKIAAVMYEAVGLSFPENKKPLIATRLGPRIKRLGLSGFDEYMALIAGPRDGGEFQVAVDLLTTNETYFFREPRHFETLEQEIAQHKPRDWQVWSAASSMGDEAYSIAMLLAEMHRRGRVSEGWGVLATDISDRVLRSAVEAIYPEDRMRLVSPDFLKRYVMRGDGPSEGLVQIQERLRQRVQFAQVNLCLPIGDLGPFDAIFLRNVLIYFDNRTKSEVVDRVLAQLRPGGLLFIGTAEGRVPCDTPLTGVGPGVFRKG